MRLGLLLVVSLLMLGLCAALELPSADANQSFMTLSSNSTHVIAELQMMTVSSQMNFDPNKVIEETTSGELAPTSEKAAQYIMVPLPTMPPQFVSFYINKTPICPLVMVNASGFAACPIPLKAVCQAVDVSYGGDQSLGIRGTSDSTIFCSSENAPLSAISQAIQNSAKDPRCIPILLLLGLLFASMFYAGKSPLALFDITTPRLPKGKKQRIGRTLVQKNWMQLRRIVAIQDRMMSRHIALATRTLADKLGTQRADLRKKIDEILKSKAKPEDKAAALKALAAGTGDRAIASILAGKLRWDDVAGAHAIDSKLDSPEMRRAFAYLQKSLMVHETNLATKKIMDTCLGTDGWTGKIPLVGGALGVFKVQARLGREFGKKVFIETSLAERLNKGILGKISPDRSARFAAWIDKNRASAERIGFHFDALDKSTRLKKEQGGLKEELITKLIHRLSKEHADAVASAIQNNTSSERRLRALFQIANKAGIKFDDIREFNDKLNTILNNKALHDMTINDRIYALYASKEGAKLFRINRQRVEELKNAGDYDTLSKELSRYLAEKQLAKRMQDHDLAVLKIASQHGISTSGKNVHEVVELIRAKGSQAAKELDKLHATLSSDVNRSKFENALKLIEKKFMVPEELENSLRQKARDAGVKNADTLLLFELKAALQKKGRQQEVDKLFREHGWRDGDPALANIIQVERNVLGKKEAGHWALRETPLQTRGKMLCERLEREIGQLAPNSFLTLERNVNMNRKMYEELVKRGIIKDVVELTELESKLQKAQGSANYKRLLEEYQAALKHYKVKSAAEAREDYDAVMKKGFTIGTEKNGVWIASSDGVFMPYYRDDKHPDKSAPINMGDRVINGRVMIKVGERTDKDGTAVPVYDRYTQLLKKHHDIIAAQKAGDHQSNFMSAYRQGIVDVVEKKEFNMNSVNSWWGKYLYGGFASNWVKAGHFVDRVFMGTVAKQARAFQEFEAISEQNRQNMMAYRSKFMSGEDYVKLKQNNALRGELKRDQDERLGPLSQDFGLRKQYSNMHNAPAGEEGLVQRTNAKTAIEVLKRGADANRIEQLKQNAALLGVATLLEASGGKGIRDLTREVRHEFKQDAVMRGAKRIADMTDPYMSTLSGISMRDIKAAHSGYGLQPMMSHLYHFGPSSQMAPHAMFAGQSFMGKAAGYMLYPSYLANIGVAKRTRAMELKVAGIGNRWDDNQFAPHSAARWVIGIREMFKPHLHRDALRVPVIRGLWWDRYVKTDMEDGTKYLTPMFSKNVFGQFEFMPPTPVDQARSISTSTWGYGSKLFGKYDLANIPGVGTLFKEGGDVKAGQTGGDYVKLAQSLANTAASARGETESSQKTMRKMQEDFAQQYLNVKAMNIPGIAYTDMEDKLRMVPRMALSIEHSDEYGYLADNDQAKRLRDRTIIEDARRDIWRRETLAIQQQMQREQEFRAYTPEKFVGGIAAFPPILLYGNIKKRFYDPRMNVSKDEQARMSHSASEPGALPEPGGEPPRTMKDRLRDKYGNMFKDTVTCPTCHGRIRRGEMCERCQKQLTARQAQMRAANEQKYKHEEEAV